MTRYELAERIGSGAMAEIFRGKAVAAGGFEKPVAIKRILPHLSQDKRFVELLIAEANILSYLRHRNIVQIFDVGIGQDGQYFLVMEYVDGVDMGALQAGLEHSRVRLPVDLGLYIGSEVCEALEYAHSQARGPDGEPMRLVHRDVSPTNVLISRSGEVKLTDFGIAKRAEEVTTHGGVRGKFAYISPEQATGRPVSARSDVFSVGILLFELLLGTRLFSNMPDFDALRCIVEGRVPRPRELDPGIDPRLEAILTKALARRPSDRFSGAGELGKELRSLRYSMPATGGDPATEIAALLERYVLSSSTVRASNPLIFDEPTVVRLAAPPGFGNKGSGVTSRSYADARQILVSFEEEATRSRVIPGDQQDNYATIDQELDLRALEAVLRADTGVDDDDTSIRDLKAPAPARKAPPPSNRRDPAAVPSLRPDGRSEVRITSSAPVLKPSPGPGQGRGPGLASTTPSLTPARHTGQLETITSTPALPPSGSGGSLGNSPGGSLGGNLGNSPGGSLGGNLGNSPGGSLGGNLGNSPGGGFGSSLPPPVRETGRLETIATIGAGMAPPPGNDDPFDVPAAAPVTATAAAAQRKSRLTRLSSMHRWALLSLGLVATAAGSFFIAGAVLRGGSRAPASAVPVDAGLPPLPPPVDASPPPPPPPPPIDAAPPAAAVDAAPEEKPKPKKSSRKKRPRKSRTTKKSTR